MTFDFATHDKFGRGGFFFRREANHSDQTSNLRFFQVLSDFLAEENIKIFEKIEISPG